MTKIYTKTGDRGTTSLFDGTRVSKANIRVDSYGSVDELNSLIGVCLSFVHDKKIKAELEKIQNDLLDIGSSLAVPAPLPVEGLPPRVLEFEKFIDSMTSKMPVLKNFILPGGGKGGSHLHLARSVSRRVERRLVLLSKKEQIDNEILIYFNRLSDLFFTMARFENFKTKNREKIWRKK